MVVGVFASRSNFYLRAERISGAVLSRNFETDYSYPTSEESLALARLFLLGSPGGEEAPRTHAGPSPVPARLFARPMTTSFPRGGHFFLVPTATQRCIG